MLGTTITEHEELEGCLGLDDCSCAYLGMEDNFNVVVVSVIVIVCLNI